MTKKFEVGKKYSATSACDHNCVWTFTVIKRTDCTITITNDEGEKTSRRKIYTNNEEEYVLPLGKYSMCPVLRVSNEVVKDEEEVAEKTMNAEQKAYMEAKAEFDAITDAQNLLEKAYIKNRNLTDENGKLLDSLYAIEDDDLYCEHIDRFEELMTESGLEKKRIVAVNNKILAENNLIKFALSIAPKSVRDTLGKHTQNIKVREKLLDLAFRLDVTTIKTARV